MWFLVAGLLLLVLWLADLGPFGALHWGWIVLPFALAAIWWAIADATGVSQRRAMRKMEERKVARRQRDMEALGLDTRRDKRVRAGRAGGKRSSAPPASGAAAPDPPRRDPRM